MATDDIWILGIHMTKFGKHPDKDVVDLGAEAAMAALADSGLTMRDVGVLAAGNLMNASPGSGNSCRSRSVRPACPCNVANACATGATALAHGDHGRQGRRGRRRDGRRRREAGRRGLLGGGGQAKKDANEWTPKGRYGAVALVDGRIGTETMPGVFAQIGMEYGTATAARASSCSPRSPRRTMPTRRRTRSPPTRSASRSRRS